MGNDESTRRTEPAPPPDSAGVRDRSRADELTELETEVLEFAALRWKYDGARESAVRDRFGWQAIGYGPVALEKHTGVPDAFRSLAEKEL